MTAAVAVDSGDEVAATGSMSVALRAVAGAYVVAALLIAGTLTLAGDADWWRGFLAASVITLMASAATVPIIAWGMRVAGTRPDLTGGAFFASAGVRAVIVLGAASLAVFQGGYPKMPTMLLVVPYYFALLAAETVVLVRPLWKSGGGKSDATGIKHD